MKLIKVGAVWCPACLIMGTRINKVVDKYDLDFISYDYDIDSDKIVKYEVGNILPELILIDDNGTIIRKLIGEQSIKKIEEFVGK